MGRPSKLSKALPLIESYFKQNEKVLYTPVEIREAISMFDLPQNAKIYEIIDFLKSLELREYKLTFSHESYTRYSWGPLNEYLVLDIAGNLKRSCYLSHYSAIFLHQLTEQIPKKIYVSFEQSPKPAMKGKLIQSNIDRGFRSSPRITNNIAEADEYTIYLLNGKCTNHLGVTEFGGKVRISNIERTLIDATVRPFYSGGVFEVLKAFHLAKNTVSINKIKAYLAKLDYIYPYHQAIGFYLEKAGFEEERIKLIEELPKNYDFYLTHRMQETSYSKRWRLYYPKAFDNIEV